MILSPFEPRVRCSRLVKIVGVDGAGRMSMFGRFDLRWRSATEKARSTGVGSREPEDVARGFRLRGYVLILRTSGTIVGVSLTFSPADDGTRPGEEGKERDRPGEMQ